MELMNQARDDVSAEYILQITQTMTSHVHFDLK